MPRQRHPIVLILVWILVSIQAPGGAAPIPGLLSGWGSVLDRSQHPGEGPLMVVLPESEGLAATTLERGKWPGAVVTYLQNVHGQAVPWVWNDDGPIAPMAQEGDGVRFFFDADSHFGDPALACIDNQTLFRHDLGSDYFNDSWTVVVDAVSTEGGQSNVVAGHSTLFWVKWTSHDNAAGVDFPQPDGAVVRHPVPFERRFGLLGRRSVLVFAVDRVADTATLWVDGRRLGTWPAPPTNTADRPHHFSSGGIQGHRNDAFGGLLFGVGLWGRALDQREIEQLSTQGRRP